MTQYRPIPFILDQHAEDAAILWQRRLEAVDAPHFDRTHLARLDEQLEAHIDGLRIAGAHGWDHALEAWEMGGEAGEVFCLAHLAFDLADPARIDEVLGYVQSDPDSFVPAAAGALGWLPEAVARPRIDSLLGQNTPMARRIALEAAGWHGYDPDRAFIPLIDDPNPQVRAAAARLAGQLGRADLRAALFVQRPDDTDESRFWTSWAATMLGDRDAAPGYLLDAARRAEAPDWQFGFLTAILSAGPDHGWQWLDSLPLDPHGVTLRILGFGHLGEVQAVDWLIDQMSGTEFGFLAGEAYSLITGVDLALDDLETDPPEEYDPGPSDDPEDEDVGIDPNEDLPLPEPALVARHWAGLQPDLPPGRLYLGKERSAQTFEHGFMTGYQRQRRLAALALALQSDGAPLKNWHVPVRGISLF